MVGEGVDGGVVADDVRPAVAAASPDHPEAAVMVVVTGGGRGVVHFHSSGILCARGRRTNFPLGSLLARSLALASFRGSAASASFVDRNCLSVNNQSKPVIIQNTDGRKK